MINKIKAEIEKVNQAMKGRAMGKSTFMGSERLIVLEKCLKWAEETRDKCISELTRLQNKYDVVPLNYCIDSIEEAFGSEVGE